MTRKPRLTDWLMRGVADYAHSTPHAHRPDGGPEESAYLDGWRAAALDDLAARLREVTP